MFNISMCAFCHRLINFKIISAATGRLTGESIIFLIKSTIIGAFNHYIDYYYE